MGAAALSFAGGIGALFQTATYASWIGPMPFTNFTLLLNPLAGLLIAVIAALAFVAWLYGLSYFDEYYEAGIGVIGFFMNLFIASMNLVILADNAFWFLVFFELMSLTSYVLVIIDRTVGIAPAERHAPALSNSVLSIVSDVGAWFGRMESGDFRTYIVYIVGALVFFLALIILVR